MTTTLTCPGHQHLPDGELLRLDVECGAYVASQYWPDPHRTPTPPRITHESHCRTRNLGCGGGRMTTLGNRLRELREAAGMTQYELARTLATGQNRISDHEVSAHIPTLPMLRRYADAHGTTVSNLLAGVM